jgi:drug/metabolite transporter (DMT)-like permease
LACQLKLSTATDKGSPGLRCKCRTSLPGHFPRFDACGRYKSYDNSRPGFINPHCMTTPSPSNTDLTAPPAWLSFAPVIFVLLWSTGFIGARLTGPYAEPLSFLTIRFAIVAVLLGGAGLVMHARWPDKRLALHCMITGALMHGGYLGFVFWSIWKGMPAGVSALIVGLQPLVTALLAGMMLGERITARHWTGLLVGLAGVAMVVWPKFTLTAEGITPVTVAANVFAMLSITFGSLYQKRFMGSVDLRTGNALQFIGAAAVLLLAALATERFRHYLERTGHFRHDLAGFCLVHWCHQPAVPDDPAWRDIAHHNAVLPGPRRHGIDRLADVR